MKRLTITLTDEEYAELERQAKAERRTVRQMAEYLVTRPSRVGDYFRPLPLQPIVSPPTWPPFTITSDRTDGNVAGPRPSA